MFSELMIFFWIPLWIRPRLWLRQSGLAGRTISRMHRLRQVGICANFWIWRVFSGKIRCLAFFFGCSAVLFICFVSWHVNHATVLYHSLVYCLPGSWNLYWQCFFWHNLELGKLGKPTNKFMDLKPSDHPPEWVLLVTFTYQKNCIWIDRILLPMTKAPHSSFGGH